MRYQRFTIYILIFILGFLPLRAFAEEHPNIVRIPLNGKYLTLNPGISADMLSTEVQTQLFIGLTQYDPKNLKPLPYFAQKWTVSSDMKEYIFYLRKDAKWTSGDPVTAHDIVWAIRRNINPETKSDLAYFLYILKNGEKINKGKIQNITELGVHLIDDYTIEFQLENAASYFPAMAAYTPFWPLPRKAIAQYGDKWTNPENIVTNGPYQLREVWEKEQITILEKNPDFFGSDLIKIPEIHYMVMDKDIAFSMYKENELDILGGEYMPLPIEKIPDIKSDPELSKDFSNMPRLCTYYLGFNNTKSPTNNLLVRKAISAAINREEIVKTVTKGEEEPAYTFTRPPIFGSVDPKENVGIHFDPKKAREWIKEAGYPDGKGFPECVYLHNEDEFHKKIALSIQKQLQTNINIKIKIKSVTWEEYMNIFGSPYDANIYRAGWCADYPDANNWLMENFHPSKSMNTINWHNEEFASLVEKAQKVTDPFMRKSLYRKAEQILCEKEAGIVPIFYNTNMSLVKPWLEVKIWPLLGNHIRYWSFR